MDIDMTESVPSTD